MVTDIVEEHTTFTFSARVRRVRTLYLLVSEIVRSPPLPPVDLSVHVPYSMLNDISTPV